MKGQEAERGKRKQDFNEEIKTKTGIKKKKGIILAFETVQLFDGSGCG